MSAYVTQADIEGQLSPAGLIGALDDTGSGTLNTTTMNNIIANASSNVDAALGALYAVPFNPIPPAVFNAALTICCYMITRRALTPDERNPFYAEYRETMNWLKLVQKGEIGFDQTVNRAFAPVSVNATCLTIDDTTA